MAAVWGRPAPLSLCALCRSEAEIPIDRDGNPFSFSILSYPRTGFPLRAFNWREIGGNLVGTWWEHDGNRAGGAGAMLC